MFETLDDYTVDPIMQASSQFRADPRSDKLDLTVGVYQDETGNAPILQAVKEAEQILIRQQSTKAYMPLTGDPEYCALLGNEVFGADFEKTEAFFSAQTAGGAVAIRVMADLVAALPYGATVWIQTPTYSNYSAILHAAGARSQSVPYYDPIRREITFSEMLEGLEKATPGDVFLFQGACHNPTGADMSSDQIAQLLDTLEERRIIPALDLAYLGFSQGFTEDCATARNILKRFPECFFCVSLSKSLGIYRDRAGALFAKTRGQDYERASKALSAMIRSGVSHAPDHGAAIAKLIFSTPRLKRTWLESLGIMRVRVAGLRDQIVGLETELADQPILSYLKHQVGMFSLLPFTEAQEAEFRRQSGIYLVKGARINIARVDQASMERLIGEAHSVLGTS